MTFRLPAETSGATSYTNWISPGLAAVIGAGLMAAVVAPDLVPFLYLGLAGWAIRSPRSSLEALSLSAFLTMVNPGLVDFEPSAFRWLVLLGAVVPNLGAVTQISAWPQPIKALPPLGAGIALSGLFGYSVGLSVAKAATFLVGVAVVLIAATVTSHQADHWRRWFFTLFGSIALPSLLLSSSDTGYYLNNTGLQGVLDRPQQLGVVLAVLFVWLLATVLWQEQTWLLEGALVVTAVLAFLTEARGALMAAVVAVIATAAIRVGRRKHGDFSHSRRRNRRLVFYGALAVLVGLVFWTGVQDATSEFLYKRGSVDLVDSVGARIEQIEWSLENFKESPFLGIGFGLPSDPAALSGSVTYFAGFPVAAPVEKVFLPSAVLEETGAMGAALLLVFLAALSRPILRFAGLPWVAAYVAILFSNFGEANFFSLGGAGLLNWVVMALAFGNATWNRSLRRGAVS